MRSALQLAYVPGSHVSNLLLSLEESNQMPLHGIPLNCILIVAGELVQSQTHGLA
jgi:hypothetical protein